MEIRQATGPGEAETCSTEEFRERFLVQGLFTPGETRLVYTHHDRMILGGVVPLNETLVLEVPQTLKTGYFLERREIGMFNIGGPGSVEAGGERYALAGREALYVGRGTREVVLGSKSADDPARFYLVSTLAHAEHETRKVAEENAEAVRVGSPGQANERTLRKYIHGGGARSCQLMMGITTLSAGSVWNTMPPHVHDRRSEIYLYFGLPAGERVLHFMGEPQETRHLVVADEEAVISPPWSIHAGAGTASYSFVWAMAGENYTFEDMDPVPMDEMR